MSIYIHNVNRYILIYIYINLQEQDLSLKAQGAHGWFGVHRDRWRAGLQGAEDDRKGWVLQKCNHFLCCVCFLILDTCPLYNIYIYRYLYLFVYSINEYIQYIFNM